MNNEDYYSGYEEEELTPYEKVVRSLYDNKLPYQDNDYDKYIAEEIAKLDDIPLTVKERQEKIQELKNQLSERESEVRKAYREESDRIYNEFCKDCEKFWEFAVMPEAVKQQIHYEAWDRGHYAGYSEVLVYYEDLVEFAKLCQREFTK